MAIDDFRWCWFRWMTSLRIFSTISIFVRRRIFISYSWTTTWPTSSKRTAVTTHIFFSQWDFSRNCKRIFQKLVLNWNKKFYYAKINRNHFWAFSKFLEFFLRRCVSRIIQNVDLQKWLPNAFSELKSEEKCNLKWSRIVCFKG